MQIKQIAGLTFLTAGLMIAGAGLAHADDGRACDQAAHHGHAGRPMQHLMAKLELDPSQRDQIKAILESNRDTFREHRQALRNIKQRMLKAVSDDDYDSQLIESLANEKAKLSAEVAVQRSQMMREIYMQLTPEQQEKFLSMQQRRFQRRS